MSVEPKCKPDGVPVDAPQAEGCDCVGFCMGNSAHGVQASRNPLAIWREICEEAPACVNEGRKYLMVNENACIDLGTALEDAYGVKGLDDAQR